MNAINYLSTFSKLIRSVLTHSVSNEIRLTDEIELLNNYVNLELTRFENKFTFDLIIDENVDVDNIEVPSLLIQPYVENAILHGLYNNPDAGRLIIAVSQKGDNVIFRIEDNGIGRNAAARLRQQNFPNHKSMGAKLTEERLRLINEHRKVSVTITDLVNDDRPCGTRVLISVAI